MNLLNVKSNLEANLTAITGVTNWEAIQFSMLPGDNPIGYLQLSQVNTGAVQELVWLVGIGFASITLNDLWSQVYGSIEAVQNSIGVTGGCTGDGAYKLDGPIECEIPDSYVNQGEFTATNGYRTAITFPLRLSLG